MMMGRSPAMMGRGRAIMCSKWLVPGFCLVIGIAVLIASWLGGNPALGVSSLVLMVAFGLAMLLLARRSETVRGLIIRRDERFAQIDLRATAVCGVVVLITLIVAWCVRIAQGHSGAPYDWLLAVGGLSYILAVALLRWRG